jgi:hypothetical protein
MSIPIVGELLCNLAAVEFQTTLAPFAISHDPPQLAQNREARHGPISTLQGVNAGRKWANHGGI